MTLIRNSHGNSLIITDTRAVNGTAMKSNASAGFQRKPQPEGIAATHGNQPNIEEKKEKSEEEHFKELEEEVHRLLE